jgi:hypothetical protein
MKFLLRAFLLLAGPVVMAQSPAYNIVLQMADSITPYQMEMKLCKTIRPTRFKNWFAHDTSKIKWKKLATADYACGEYFTGERFDDPRKNSFKAANQAMLWEHILLFKVTSPGNSKPMYILIPIFIQSFITSVIIKDVPFKPGIYELDDLKTTINGMRIIMQANSSHIWNDGSGNRKYKVKVD